MKRKYLKPEANFVELEIKERLMDGGYYDGSFEIGEDDEEGI